MTLTPRWDPFRELAQIQDRVARALAGAAAERPQEPTEAYGAWAPPVDIFETDEALVIQVEVPGVRREDIDVEIEDGVLVVRGERKRQVAVDEKNAYRLERLYGPFIRNFTLPKTVDASKVRAAYRDGVLEIMIPKAEEARPKKVEIQSA